MVFIGDDTARRKDVEARLIEAHEAERTRIAGELHDDIGQRMAVADDGPRRPGARRFRYRSDEARTRIRALSDRDPRSWRGTSRRSRTGCTRRSWIPGYRRPRPHPSAARCRGSRTWTSTSAMTAFRTACRITWRCALFRVLQEAVTNAVRHAGVRQVAVTLRGTPDEIRLEIVDAGVGFDRGRGPAAAARSG